MAKTTETMSDSETKTALSLLMLYHLPDFSVSFPFAQL